MLSIEFQFIYRHYLRFIVLMSFNTRVKRRDDNLFSVGQSLCTPGMKKLKCFKRRSEVCHEYDQVCQCSIFFVIYKFDDIRPNFTNFIRLSDKLYVVTVTKYKLCLWSNSMRLMINSGQ